MSVSHQTVNCYFTKNVRLYLTSYQFVFQRIFTKECPGRNTMCQFCLWQSQKRRFLFGNVKANLVEGWVQLYIWLCRNGLHPAERISNSDSFVNSYIMVGYFVLFIFTSVTIWCSKNNGKNSYWQPLHNFLRTSQTWIFSRQGVLGTVHTWE